RDLAVGLLFAAVLVYLLMVLHYQNFGDPFVVMLALPATFCGILTMLFITGTTLSVPSLMGAIMAVGVASANSILLVTFAREQQLAGKTAFEAAIDAGHTRIRPVLMTAAAMIVGMVPMALGGAGEEQNAALARAVLGGGLAFGASRHYAQYRQVMATAEQRRDLVPTVRVATVRPSNGITLVTLPATTLAFAAANLYARASGYIDKRNVDIGDRVKD